MSIPVDHLKNVELTLKTADRIKPFNLIFGIASDGLCPFEYELLNKTPGEQIHLMIKRSEAAPIFAHLYLPIRKALEMVEPPETLDLVISVEAVSDAEPREIVRAMAQAAEQSGCGGDCACGCGGH